ncbi:MAG: STAS domain-containing protein [Caldilineaceae bacterium]|nr:STAS domain-containing protein [Caldilineaceae bacterium]
MKIGISEEVVRTVRIRIEDRLDAFSAQELRAHFDELFEQGVTNYVIDLSATPFMDSAGMAVLVSAMKRARQAGGDVALVWPDADAVKRILKLTHFDRVFTMLDA